MQYLFTIEKRQFAKPKINIESQKARRREKRADWEVKEETFQFSFAAEMKSVFVLRNRNFSTFISNKNIKYLLTITKSFCFIYWNQRQSLFWNKRAHWKIECFSLSSFDKEIFAICDRGGRVRVECHDLAKRNQALWVKFKRVVRTFNLAFRKNV